MMMTLLLIVIFLPTGSSTFAYENFCGVCVGGSTGLPDDSGLNACGQCESDPDANEDLCKGCDGVPNRFVTMYSFLLFIRQVLI